MSAAPTAPESVTDSPTRSAHTCPSADVLAALGSNLDQGLTEAAVEPLSRRYRPNALAETPPVPGSRQMLDQFTEPVVWLLLGAGVIAAALAEWPTSSPSWPSSC